MSALRPQALHPQARLLVWLVALSALSGAAALIYEIVWFQLLELVIGSSAISTSLLLAAFMGGICLGSLLFPRWISRVRNPLAVYALMELGIGLSALLVLFVLPHVAGAYFSWAGGGVSGVLLRGVVGGLVLLPPSILMGGVLPQLARACGSEDASPVGWLYGSNIVGGAFGCLLAGFYLLREFDLATATYAGVFVNLLLATLAWLIRGSVGPERSGTGEQPPHRGSVNPVFARDASIYGAIALSGFCALGAEVLWTRSLGLLFGPSVYTLSLVLAVYLTGLGIGSVLGAVAVRCGVNPRGGLAVCQLLSIPTMAWTAYTVNAAFPYWPVNPSLSTDIWFNFQIDLCRAFWALLLPTMVWGGAFPFAVAATERRGADPGVALGHVYVANTFGAVAGALGVGLLLVSFLGSQRVEQVLLFSAAVSCLLPLFSTAATSKRWLFPGFAAAAVCCALGIYVVPPVSRELMAHGRFASSWVGKGDIVYAAEGLSSSVAVSRFASGVTTFHVAGKIQASDVPRDLRLQRMLGHLTTLTASSPKSVLVIGCGAGVTAGAVAIDPAVERVTLVEIERLVPGAASTYFSGPNFNVLQNPKVQLHIDDGRHYLMTTKEHFDGITADPLDPWVKGAANLYTREFLESARRHLNPGGTITLYVQLFETNLDAVKSLMATFFEVFPNGSVWGNTYEGKGHDLVLLGQTEARVIDVNALEEKLQRREYARVFESLREVGMNSAFDLLSTYAGRPQELGSWLQGAQINTDRNLRMQYLAGLGLNLDESASIYADLLKFRKFPEGLFGPGEAGLRDRLEEGAP